MKLIFQSLLCRCWGSICFVLSFIPFISKYHDEDTSMCHPRTEPTLLYWYHSDWDVQIINQHRKKERNIYFTASSPPPCGGPSTPEIDLYEWHTQTVGVSQRHCDSKEQKRKFWCELDQTGLSSFTSSLVVNGSDRAGVRKSVML